MAAAAVKLVWSPEARGQLQDILDYIAEDKKHRSSRRFPTFTESLPWQ
jgi:plasmid stabilization system protein ParE